jgi:hypothetical protein
MVKRRKFMIGAGSLLAGGAAAMGTGAVTESEVDRGLSGQVAGDHNGYIYIRPGYANGQHVTTNGDGTVSLDFGSMSGGGDGLNPDSTNYFDGLFRVGVNDEDQIPGGDPEYDLWITENTNADRAIDFYRSGNPNNSLVGPGNKQAVENEFHEDMEIGVCIDLQGENMAESDSLSDLFGADASFTIHIERVGGPGQ